MIRELTPALLRAQACDAAEQRIPMEEANHHEPQTWLRLHFAEAYRKREWELRLQEIRARRLHNETKDQP